MKKSNLVIAFIILFVLSFSVLSNAQEFITNNKTYMIFDSTEYRYGEVYSSLESNRISYTSDYIFVNKTKYRIVSEDRQGIYKRITAYNRRVKVTIHLDIDNGYIALFDSEKKTIYNTKK